MIDICAPIAENWTSSQIETGEEMASQPERIATLESSTKWQWIVISAAILGGVGWLGYLTTKIDNLTGDVRAIKQKLDDKGLGSIVSQIQNPQNTDTLRASLKVVSSQIELSRAQGAIPKKENLRSLSTAVAEATIEHPTINEVWQTAFSLVSYRSTGDHQQTTAEQGSCFATNSPRAVDQLRNSLQEPGGTLPPNIYGFVISNCILELDDLAAYRGSAMEQFFELESRNAPQLPRVLALDHVSLRYSGGTIIPVQQIIVTHCTFQFAPPTSSPPAPGRSLVRDLLASTDLSAELHFDLNAAS